MLEQISIFSENEKGALSRMTDILRENNINLQAMIVNDSAEFGIIRFLLEDAKSAQKILEKEGYLCHSDGVYAAVISDEVGGLSKLLKDVAEIGINIDYIYMSHDRESGEPIAVFHTKDMEAVEEALTWRGYRMV
jgi:hypothetical protein